MDTRRINVQLITNHWSTRGDRAKFHAPLYTLEIINKCACFLIKSYDISILVYRLWGFARNALSSSHAPLLIKASNEFDRSLDADCLMFLFK